MTQNVTVYEGDAYLGIDCGSTTTKLVLIGEDDQILFHHYQSNKGNPADVIREQLTKLYELCGDRVHIVSSAVTGYGEALIQNAFGVEDLSKADLQKGAKDYMKAIGLTDAEITDLMVNLGYVAPVEPVTPSKPDTGDTGIVVYLGLGVMALAGGVLVAKKKEQF